MKEIVNKMSSFLPFIAMIAIFYFMIIRPQNKKRKEMEEMINNLKIGDKVITHSGICGTIKNIIDNNKIELQVSENSHIQFIRNAVARLEVETKT